MCIYNSFFPILALKIFFKTFNDKNKLRTNVHKVVIQKKYLKKSIQAHLKITVAFEIEMKK